MRKILLIILVLGAAGIYLYDVLLLVNPRKTDAPVKVKEQTPAVSIEKLLADAKPVEFVVKGRDPFSPRKVEPKPVTAASSSKSASSTRPTVDPKAPTVTISGIMWNPSSPIAMLKLPDGSGVVARPGQTFGDITVSKIEKTRVRIVFNKKTYWICQ